MLDIYEFFHSPDIAEHCKKINHRFNPLEMLTPRGIVMKTFVYLDDTLSAVIKAWYDGKSAERAYSTVQ